MLNIGKQVHKINELSVAECTCYFIVLCTFWTFSAIYWATIGVC